MAKPRYWVKSQDNPRAPVVYKRKRKKKKKKKRYSRGLKDFQRSENEFSKTANRLTKAARTVTGDPLTSAAREFTQGYRRRRRKSARKRRDGALQDIVVNVFDSTASATGLVVPFVSGAVDWISATEFREELVRQTRAATRSVIRPFR